MKYVIAYAGSAVAMAALDAAWLGTMGPRVYRPALGALLTEGFRFGPAIAFYMLYVAGLTVFAVRPTLASGQWTATAAMGALFGFFCYATYDLTNMATLRVWPLKIVLLDIAWGVALSALAATAGLLAARRFA
jgi:uncharacterized membrane protein